MLLKSSFRLKYYVCIFLMMLLPLSSCGPQYKAAREERKMEKAQEDRRKEGERIMRQARKRHIQNQSRDTRQRMRETRRKSYGINNIRNKPFYVRWYYAITKPFRRSR